MRYRQLPGTELKISEVALGCWPIAGLTSPGVNDADSLATIDACFELGINHLDTAYCYGHNGESERLIARALGKRRHEFVIASKGGIHWSPEGRQVLDARPATLRRQCEESLRRLETDCIDLYYLHSPDKTTPVTESAGELRRLLDEGKIRAVGVSNVDLAQLCDFAAACPLAALQPPYNLITRQIEADALPWCREHGVAVIAYWPLMKGLLAGKISRDQVFGDDDSRRKYPQFQGDERQKNHDLVDALQSIALQAGYTVGQLAVAWVLAQSGITSALCGAKRPAQIRETAPASDWTLTTEQLAAVDEALARRGQQSLRLPV
jgi:aryl-alcohol dehydrogenase-like predicted oxidoreductase